MRYPVVLCFCPAVCLFTKLPEIVEGFSIQCDRPEKISLFHRIFPKMFGFTHLCRFSHGEKETGNGPLPFQV